MTPKYMLDTNMGIYLMKHYPPEVGTRFARCYAGEVVISSVTPAELEYGAAASGEPQPRNRAALSWLLEDLAVATFDSAAARAHGPIRLATRERRRGAH